MKPGCRRCHGDGYYEVDWRSSDKQQLENSNVRKFACDICMDKRMVQQFGLLSDAALKQGGTEGEDKT